MKHSYYILLCIGIVFWGTSCKTIVAGKTIPAKNIQIADHTIIIRIQDEGNLLSEVMDKVHQFIIPVDVQFHTYNDFLNQEREIQIKIKTIPYSKINEMRNVLYKVAGVMRVSFI